MIKGWSGSVVCVREHQSSLRALSCCHTAVEPPLCNRMPRAQEGLWELRTSYTLSTCLARKGIWLFQWSVTYAIKMISDHVCGTNVGDIISGWRNVSQKMSCHLMMQVTLALWRHTVLRAAVMLSSGWINDVIILRKTNVLFRSIFRGKILNCLYPTGSGQIHITLEVDESIVS